MNANGVTAGIREGGKGQFDVVVGDEVVFSKQQEGRFPEEDEILRRLTPA